MRPRPGASSWAAEIVVRIDADGMGRRFSSSWGAPRGARTRGPAAGTTTPPPRRPTVLAIRAASGSTSLALGPSAKLRLIGKAQVELSRPAMKHGLRGNRDILRSPFGYRASESSAERLLGVALLRLMAIEHAAQGEARVDVRRSH